MLPHSPVQPWPEERDFHTAYSMYDPDSNPADPCLLIVAGSNKYDEPLGDVWLFRVNDIQWEEVSEL